MDDQHENPPGGDQVGKDFRQPAAERKNLNKKKHKKISSFEVGDRNGIKDGSQSDWRIGL